MTRKEDPPSTTTVTSSIKKKEEATLYSMTNFILIISYMEKDGPREAGSIF